ncbi:MAG: HAD family hydrolase [Bacteroidetes bacterium]|nr:HAD family hydrolase [Bacteroidota bacterium]
MAKAVFLDRDGTINRDVGYLSRKEDIEILPGAFEALRTFKRLGFLNIVITNQSGIARGYYTEEELKEIHDEFLKILNAEEKLIDDIFYSPYHSEGIVKEFAIEHETRKPGTGMIEQAAAKYNIDLSQSIFIGDSLVDMQCAQNAGIKKILVLTGYGETTKKKCAAENIILEHIAGNLLAASEIVRKILKTE